MSAEFASDPAKNLQVKDSPLQALPSLYDLRLVYVSSLVIALLAAIASIVGLLFQGEIYPTDDLRESFVANDVVNLLIGLPILLGAMWLTRCGRLLGLLFWPGALFYGLYNYLTYLLGMPFNAMYPVYLAIVTLSIYTMFGLLAGVEGQVVRQGLSGRVPERLAGGLLVVFGILFILLAAGGIVGALVNQEQLPRSELALLTSDAIVSGAWVIGGVLLWRRRALGYVGGTGLLFQASMLFIGLIAILILQPLISDVPLPVTDILTTLVMGLVCFVPFVLFVRGVIKADATSAAGAS